MRVPEKSWTLFSNHGMVLFYLAANPDSTMRDLSDALGITERQIARIVKNLADAEMLWVQRRGRRNFYSVNPSAHFRHPALAHFPLRQVIETLSQALVAGGGTRP